LSINPFHMTWKLFVIGDQASSKSYDPDKQTKMKTEFSKKIYARSA
jgi:hypothetical protein